MKILSVGRDPDCDIYIDDQTGMVSRRHASIRVKPFGIYELIDLSKNGTSINSNPMVPGKAKRIKRGDSVTFAGVGTLDWKLVPDTRRPWIYAGIALLLVVVALLVLWFANDLKQKTEKETDEPLNTEMVVSDQTSDKAKDQADKKEGDEIRKSVPSIQPKPQPKPADKGHKAGEKKTDKGQGAKPDGGNSSSDNSQSTNGFM